MAMCEELHCKEFLTPLDYYQDYKDYKKLGWYKSIIFLVCGLFKVIQE
jgi:hypothetical protein